MQKIDWPVSWEQEKLKASEMTSICNCSHNDAANNTATTQAGFSILM